jgi:hypothetical protein
MQRQENPISERNARSLPAWLLIQEMRLWRADPEQAEFIAGRLCWMRVYSVIPPSTGSVAPLMYPADSLARKTTARATSSGLPKRRQAMYSFRESLIESFHAVVLKCCQDNPGGSS